MNFAKALYLCKDIMLLIKYVLAYITGTIKIQPANKGNVCSPLKVRNVICYLFSIKKDNFEKLILFL